LAAKLTRLSHKIAIQLHLVAGEVYHLQFSLQAASPETFGYTLVYFEIYATEQLEGASNWTYLKTIFISVEVVCQRIG